MATFLSNIRRPILALEGIFHHLGISEILKGAAPPSSRGDSASPRRDVMVRNSESSQDNFSIRLSPEEVAAAKKALSDPKQVVGLHEEGRRRYDARWGLDPKSPTTIEAIGIKKAP